MRSTHAGERGRKCLVGPNEQRKWQEEHMEGTGGFRGCAGIWADPRQGPAVLPLLLGVPLCPARGAAEEMEPEPPALHSTGSAGTKQLPAAPCGCPGWVLLCLSLAGGCWGHVWGLGLKWELKATNGDTHMECPSCRSTPGGGGGMDGEGTQNRTSRTLCVRDNVIFGLSSW